MCFWGSLKRTPSSRKMDGVLVGDTSLANTKAGIAWKWRSSCRPVELSLTVNVAVAPAARANGPWPSLTDPLVR